MAKAIAVPIVLLSVCAFTAAAMHHVHRRGHLSQLYSPDRMQWSTAPAPWLLFSFPASFTAVSSAAIDQFEQTRWRSARVLCVDIAGDGPVLSVRVSLPPCASAVILRNLDIDAQDGVVRLKNE